jgi:hypothetical protein
MNQLVDFMKFSSEVHVTEGDINAVILSHSFNQFKMTDVQTSEVSTKPVSLGLSDFKFA